MKKLCFEGCSDDTFGEYGLTNDDVDNCGSGNPIQCLISSTEGSLLVIGQYGTLHLDNGCWIIGISMAKENSEIPNWPISYKMAESGYSPQLFISVPDDATLTWFDNCKKVM